MKQSGIDWIGPIPDSWGTTRIKYVLKESNIRSIDGKELPLSLGRVCGLIPTAQKEQKNLQSESYVNAKVVYPGEIVFNRFKARVFAISSYHGVVSPDYAVYQDKGNHNLKYFVYLFGTEPYRAAFDNKASGIGDGFSRLYTDDLFSMPTILPSYNEQSRIVAFLDDRCAKIDEAIARHDALIKKLDEYRKAVITEAVTKGVRGEREVKKTGTAWIDTIPCDWEFKRFKFIADNLFKGNGITKDQVFLDGDTPCVRYGEIYSKYDGSFDKCFSLTRLDIQDAPRFFKQGDILFAGTGELIEEIGKNIIYLGNEQCLAGGDIIVAQHKHNGVFLNYALNSSYAQAQKSYGKAKLKVVHISATEIGDVLVALPPKDEQAEIAAYLDEKCAAIDAAKERHAQLMAKLEEYKKSLIYYAVTGKIEC